MHFAIPEQHQHVFKAVAYMIERKLLDIQMSIVAHRQGLRFVSLEYKNDMSEEKLQQVEKRVTALYDMLDAFCTDYDVPKQKVNFGNELLIKANFLWEDVSGATTKSMRGYGKLDEAIIGDYEQKINEFINAANQLIQSFNSN